jgi:diguanylate cyclase
MTDNTYLAEIENEYSNIEKLWLQLQLRTLFWFAVCAFCIECILGTILFRLGFVQIPLQLYLYKYIAVPTAANSLIVALAWLIVRFPRLSLRHKAYGISIASVAAGFVIYSVHSLFPSLYLIFSFPILLTVVYGDYPLTSVTAALSVAAMTVSELYVKWDPEKLGIHDNAVGVPDYVLSVTILLMFYAACVVVIHVEKKKNSACIQKELERIHFQKRLQTDELTGVRNRIALRKAFQEMEADTSGSLYFFVMIDLDNFKKLNDTMGHNRGDRCLKEFGGVLKRVCGEEAVFRFGGDEFCILFKDRKIQEVVRYCEAVQSMFAAFSAHLSPEAALSASFGIARYERGMSATRLLKNSDSALYSAKDAKNTIRIFEDIG